MKLSHLSPRTLRLALDDGADPRSIVMTLAYDAGMTLATVGRYFGVTRERVRQLIAPFAVRRKRTCLPPTHDHRLRLEELWARGMSVREIALDLGLAHGSAQQLVVRGRRAGWTLPFRNRRAAKYQARKRAEWLSRGAIALNEHIARDAESLRGVARKLGRDISSVSRYASGHQLPSLEVAARIDEIFAIPAAWWTLRTSEAQQVSRSSPPTGTPGATISTPPRPSAERAGEPAGSDPAVQQSPAATTLSGVPIEGEETNTTSNEGRT